MAMKKYINPEAQENNMHKKHVKRHVHETKRHHETKKYLHESFPRRSYHRGIVIRPRKPFEIFWQEILFTLFIIFVLIMLTVNYVSNQNYVRQNVTQKPENVVDVSVKITKGSNLCQVYESPLVVSEQISM
jgi:hypothetical protein